MTMRLYTVHERRHQNKEGLSSTDVVLVPDKFCWPAFLFPITLVWMVYRRLWLVMAALAVAAILFVALLSQLRLPPGAESLFMFVLLLWLGQEANNLRRLSLRRQGYEQVDVIAGADLEEAERRYFSGRKSLSDVIAPVAGQS